jgi:hypothetical protein
MTSLLVISLAPLKVARKVRRVMTMLQHSWPSCNVLLSQQVAKAVCIDACRRMHLFVLISSNGAKHGRDVICACAEFDSFDSMNASTLATRSFHDNTQLVNSLDVSFIGTVPG